MVVRSVVGGGGGGGFGGRVAVVRVFLLRVCGVQFSEAREFHVRLIRHAARPQQRREGVVIFCTFSVRFRSPTCRNSPRTRKELFMETVQSVLSNWWWWCCGHRVLPK